MYHPILFPSALLPTVTTQFCPWKYNIFSLIIFMYRPVQFLLYTHMNAMQSCLCWLATETLACNCSHSTVHAEREACFS